MLRLICSVVALLGVLSFAGCTDDEPGCVVEAGCSAVDAGLDSTSIQTDADVLGEVEQ